MMLKYMEYKNDKYLIIGKLKVGDKNDNIYL